MTVAVWAAVLAAGAGRRMGGRAKALLPLAGGTFLEAVVAAARGGGVDGVVVVVGHHAEQVEPLAREVADRVARNPAPDRGMGTSIREAARAVPDGAALLVWPVDVPAVRPATVAAVLAAAKRTPGRTVVPVHRGSSGGHPTLLPPRLLEKVRALDETERLDRLVEADDPPPLRLEVDDPGVSRDVDRVEDLVRLDGSGDAPVAVTRRFR